MASWAPSLRAWKEFENLEGRIRKVFCDVPRVSLANVLSVDDY